MSTPDSARDPTNDPDLADHIEEYLPDLMIWGPSAQPLSDDAFEAKPCEIEEGCATSETRRVLRFETETRNVSESDLDLGNPCNNELFSESSCKDHGHRHFDGFFDYSLVDAGGCVVAAGGKAGSCIMDTRDYDDPANVDWFYGCEPLCHVQGIQAGWADVYPRTLACQFIDITGVPGGSYFLRLEVNPEVNGKRPIPESNYSNNVTLVPCDIPGPPCSAPDICCAAIAFDSVPFGVSLDTTCATPDGASTHSCASGKRDNNIWFQVTPSSTIDATLSTCGSTYDTILRVYTGACGALTPFACADDDGQACAGLNASINVRFTAGTSYWIELASFNPGGGGLEFSARTLCSCPDDGNPCTDDFCLNGVCVHPNKLDGAPCGNPTDTECDNPDSCLGGVCIPNYEQNGTPCQNGANPCTTDVCNGNGACIHENKPNGTLCNDGFFCTATDTCANGICVGTGNPCDGEFCDEVTDSCIQPCGDGTCDLGENPCNCPQDCGSPPPVEANCSDGAENDCDGDIDCVDTDCPECPSDPCLSRWDTEIGNPGMTGGPVRALADTFNGSTVGSDGAVLYAGSGPEQSVAKWNGASWVLLPGLPWGSVYALAAHNDGAGNALYAGGGFGQTGGPWYMARWYGNGSGWGAVGQLFDDTLPNFSGQIRALIEFNGKLYAGGAIHINPVHIYARRWNGNTWEDVQNGLNDTVWAFGVFSGDLYAGGTFWYVAGGDPTRGRIARWNGSSWLSIGTGITGNSVVALGVFDDGNGLALYAGGDFTAAGGTGASNIARWDGSSWAPLGSGTNGSVHALAVFDDGSGPALFAGGSFTSAGGVSTNNIAKWDGTRWTALHSGLSGPVYALRAANDGTSPALFVGGNFHEAGGQTAHHVAKWRCCPAPAGSFDCDSDVDLYDFEDFNWCLTAPGGELPSGCEPADSDGDGDGDLLDWGFFQTVFTGP